LKLLYTSAKAGDVVGGVAFLKDRQERAVQRRQGDVAWIPMRRRIWRDIHVVGQLFQSHFRILRVATAPNDLDDIRVQYVVLAIAGLVPFLGDRSLLFRVVVVPGIARGELIPGAQSIGPQATGLHGPAIVVLPDVGHFVDQQIGAISVIRRPFLGRQVLARV